MFSAREPDANGMTRSVPWPEACGGIHGCRRKHPKPLMWSATKLPRPENT